MTPKNPVKVKLLDSRDVRELENAINSFLGLPDVSLQHPVAITIGERSLADGRVESHYLATIHYERDEARSDDPPTKPSSGTGLTSILKAPPPKVPSPAAAPAGTGLTSILKAPAPKSSRPAQPGAGADATRPS